MSNVQTIEHAPIAVIDYNITDAALAEMKTKYVALTVTNNKERDAVQKGITELTGLRSKVEKKRKELKADALEFGRKVDGEARRVTGLIEEIEEPLKFVRQVYDDEQERIKAEKAAKEQARVDAINAEIDRIKALPLDLPSASTEEIEKAIADIVALIQQDRFQYQEFAPVAEAAKQTVLTKLQEMLDAQIIADREAAAAEKQRQEDEAARVRLAADQAKFAAEKAEFEKQRAASADPVIPVAASPTIAAAPVQPKGAVVTAEPEMITIRKEWYDELVADSRMLQALVGAGVDNWEGYDLALESMQEAA